MGSDKEERLLECLILLTAIINSQMREKDNGEKRSLSQIFLESNVMVALITVLLGGIMGGCLTARYQESQKEREFNQSWLSSRGDQALSSFTDYLKGEQELVKRAYKLVGNCISVSDSLASQTGEAFRGEFGNNKAVEDQKSRIRNSYNETRAQWISEREELALLMNYYHPKQPELLKSWRKVQDCVTQYLDWAETWQKSHPLSSPPPKDEDIAAARAPAYNNLITSLTELSNQIERGRDYPWQGWKSPKDLKELLGIETIPKKSSNNYDSQ
jgi:hypothetical protein